MLFRSLMFLVIVVCPAVVDAADDVVRVATFNISFNRPKTGQLLDDLKGNDEQAVDVASILREVRPDIVLLNEFDFDPTGESIRIFQDQYLESSEGKGEPLEYEFSYSAEVNTGVPSGLDLNNNGRTDDPNDAFGFGRFPGQYGMVVLSRFPIQIDKVRTFRKLQWQDMPDAALPVDEAGKSWYSAKAIEKFRLSSKSHWDVPIEVGKRVVHLLASHPTPPAFDGPEDRNGRRNHDEIRLLAEYVTPDGNSDWLTDDQGQAGGLSADASFVIAGDLNADPVDGGSYQKAIEQLLNHPRVNPLTPFSAGAVEASNEQGKANATHASDPKFDTADFSDRVVGNLRVDYVLPSKDLSVKSTGVFWPLKNDPLGKEVGCTDHRLVWVDLVP